MNTKPGQIATTVDAPENANPSDDEDAQNLIDEAFEELGQVQLDEEPDYPDALDKVNSAMSALNQVRDFLLTKGG